MTYAASQVAYWVGQANDNSTGVHPPGYVTSQRWSATANAWQTAYNTEYANARDNSAGQPGRPSGNQHPTGWVAGQFWSTTATQWNTMWGTEWTNARDNSGGQTSSGLGAAHPTGWTAGQFWSATAEQWNAMWGTEWRNARDPQGYAYSYPGQAPNAVYWSQTAAFWKGQADYYWGPSRQWNNGNTWEYLYNLYVGYYNDMVQQRDTWIARANNAWGASRQWNNGESWEAAYYRVLPAPQLASGDTWLHAEGEVPYAQDTWADWSCSITTTRTGVWLIGARTRRGAYSLGANIEDVGQGVSWQSRFWGFIWGIDQATNGGGGMAWQTSGGDFTCMTLGAGTRVRARGGSGTQSTKGYLYLDAFFIPNPTYPH